MDRWPLQDAKNRFSELVRRAREKGPQVITVHGREAAVVVAASEYAGRSGRKGGLAAFFAGSPLAGVELDLSRSRDTGRPVDLRVRS